MAFLDKMKEYLDKGVEVSKEALTKAGDAVQDFSDKSVTKIESHQLVSRQNKEYRALGLAVRQFFETNPSDTLSADNSSISGILQEIYRLDKEIAQREENLKAKEQKDSADGEPAAGEAASEKPLHADFTAPADGENVADAEFTKSE